MRLALLALLTNAVVVSMASTACPEGMAYIPLQGMQLPAVCMDKYEASVQSHNGAWSSPNYNPDHKGALWQWGRFANLTAGVPAAYVPMPRRGAESLEGSGVYRPVAMSVAGVQPQGYTDRSWAMAACAHANKRLCTLDEWRTACRGPQNTTYPYGNTYRKWQCNVGQPQWPPGVLGRKNNWQMLDPRIGTVRNATNQTMRADTGSYHGCVSGYGVYDMVGNMAEIVADVPKKGFMTFVGGFYARVPVTAQHCHRTVTAHANVYNDYSIGFRCCQDPAP